jgi:hypothetical protein
VTVTPPSNTEERDSVLDSRLREEHDTVAFFDTAVSEYCCDGAYSRFELFVG